MSMTLTQICEKHKDEIPDFLEGHGMSDDMFQDLYNYYFDEMPYGTKKARDGDPEEWIAERFNEDVYCEMDLKLP